MSRKHTNRYFIHPSKHSCIHLLVTFMNVMDKCSRFPYEFIFYPPTVCAGILQPQAERVAIEALQICTLLLPPSSRRKLQLLMRMMCRISQNVDMPRLHPAIGTRTLVRPDFREEAKWCAKPCWECVSLNNFSQRIHFQRFLSYLVSLWPPPQDGAHIFRLHPGQCCRVWSGRAAGHQAGFFSTGSPRTYPLRPRVPAQRYKWPHTASTHGAGKYSAPRRLRSSGNWQILATFKDWLALLTRFLLTMRAIMMAAIALWLLSPFTPSAIRSVAPSLSSKSWHLPGRPWRSCWRCYWQTKTWPRSKDARSWSRWKHTVIMGLGWWQDVNPLFFSLFSFRSCTQTSTVNGSPPRSS